MGVTVGSPLGRVVTKRFSDKTSALRERDITMAKMVKGAKRYVLLRGKDENGDDIVIDILTRKGLDAALKDGRVDEEDHVVKIDVLGRVTLKNPKQP